MNHKNMQIVQIIRILFVQQIRTVLSSQCQHVNYKQEEAKTIRKKTIQLNEIFNEKSNFNKQFVIKK